MKEKADFLSALRHGRRLDEARSAGEVLSLPDGLLVQVVRQHGDVALRMVDREGKGVSAADYAPVGALGPMLRAMAEIGSRSLMEFSWGGDASAMSFSLSRYPFLSLYLEGCNGYIVDERMSPLKFNGNVGRVTFVLNKHGKDEYQGNFAIGDERVEAFLSPRLALTSGEVRVVEEVGSRFADLEAFTTPFDSQMLETFLSILYSTVTNLRLNFEGYGQRFIEEPMPMVPILVIEKIDSDNSLVLRVSESAGELPMDICENFSLNRIAYVADGVVTVRRLGESTIKDSVEVLNERLRENASKREAKEIWADGLQFIVPHEIASRFLFNSFARLINEFRIVGAEKLKSYKIVAAKPKLNLRVGSGIDYLEGKATVNVGGEEFTLRDLLSQYGNRRYITLSDGNKAVVDPGYMKRLQRIFGTSPKKGDDVKISFFDLPEVMDMLDEQERTGKCFDAYRKFYEGFNSLSSKRVSTPGLKATLREYQKAGVKWINYLYDTHMGGCLADDMGLGKTVQTIAMLTRSVGKTDKPSLIVMPRSLLFNWQEEFRRFAPGIKVSTHYGPARNLEESMKAQVVLTSYAMVRNDAEQLIKQKFDYVILDESQNIKNVDAQTTQAVWLLKGEHRLAISGTPIENNLTELYSLFRFLNPAMFGTLKDFTDEYAGPIQRDGDDDAARALRRKVFPFILRRLKRDVLTDLPDRTEQVLTVEMSPRQAELYEERRKYFAGEIQGIIAASGAQKASFELLQALMELRQIASVPEEKSDGAVASTKIELLMEYLIPAVRNGHKVVVFYNFLAGIELTARKLEREKIGYEVMTGATRDRQKAVERFQNDDDCRVMLMTVKTGGVGLNLVAADTVFIVEPWWNKAAEDQAINRLHRIGQKNSVNCYYLITADTIEEKIRQLQEKKSALVDAIISTDTTGGKKLSVDDINFLLSK